MQSVTNETPAKVVPFPMLSAEEVKFEGHLGKYNDLTQRLDCSSLMAGTSQFVETATGGHGDTDQNETAD